MSAFPYQGRFAEELGSPDQIADGHVEVGVAAAPVRDLGEGVRGQRLLQRKLPKEIQTLESRPEITTFCQHKIGYNFSHMT